MILKIYNMNDKYKELFVKYRHEEVKFVSFDSSSVKFESENVVVTFSIDGHSRFEGVETVETLGGEDNFKLIEL